MVLLLTGLNFDQIICLKLVTHRLSYLLSGKQNSIVNLKNLDSLESLVLAGEIHVNNFFQKSTFD